MRLRHLEKHLSASFDTEMIVVRSATGIDPALLTGSERDRLEEFRNEERQRDWLLGRRALKEIQLHLGHDVDTTQLTFPGSRISLTHAADIALAVAAVATRCGIGVDYEPLRDIDIRIARWFLDATEMDWLESQPESTRAAHLVRLWSAKEAAFKCHPDNECLTLAEFAICDPAAPVRVAVAGGRRIRLSCHAYESGYLSFAISRESA
jgi:4'-phosphopantetheinyl transferase EntD